MKHPRPFRKSVGIIPYRLVHRAMFIGLVSALLASMAAGIQAADALFPPAAPEDAGLSREKLQAALDQARAWVEEEAIAGGTLLVIRNGRTVLHESFGLANRETNRPMTNDAIYMIASMTKTLTGTAVLQLYEQGHVDLQDRVSQYIPEFDLPEIREITIYQLLIHKSGLAPWGRLRHDSFETHRDLARIIAEAGIRAGFDPGTRFGYSDRNSAVLGYLVEVISGLPLTDYIERHILEPLGMNDSFFGMKIDDDDPRVERISPAYRGDPGELRRYTDGIGAANLFGGASGLYSTPTDYARFLAAFRNGGTLGDVRLLSEENVALATRLHVERRDRGRMFDYYGLHWGIGLRGIMSHGYGHSGARGTIAFFDDESDLMVLYFTHTRRTPTRAIMVGLVHKALMNIEH